MTLRALPPPVYSAAGVVMSQVGSSLGSKGHSSLAVSRDSEISSLRHQVDELRAHQHELVAEVARLRALAVVGEGAASIAHELRNPLGGIAGFAELLARRCENHPELRDMAQKIMGGATSLSALVERLLEFVRDTPMQMRPVEWTRFLTVAVDQYEESARHRGVSVRLVRRWGEQLGKGEADAICLRQAIWNVLENAELACEARDPIEVVGERRNDGGISVSIADRGPGVDPVVAQRLFNSFVTTREQGTGLGLAMARKIIERHGGRITIANRQDGGAVVEIALPAPGAPSLLLTPGDTRS